MNYWETMLSEVAFKTCCATLSIMLIICFTAFIIGYVVDKLREHKETRKFLCEQYIRYRIDRWNKKGY